MKKYFILLSILLVSVSKTMASYEPFSQWMLFTAD